MWDENEMKIFFFFQLINELFLILMENRVGAEQWTMKAERVLVNHCGH